MLTQRSASVSEWLATVVEHGDVYAKYFNAIGAEDVGDVAIFGEDEIVALESSLQNAGAKREHAQSIKTAVAALSATHVSARREAHLRREGSRAGCTRTRATAAMLVPFVGLLLLFVHREEMEMFGSGPKTQELRVETDVAKRMKAARGAGEHGGGKGERVAGKHTAGKHAAVPLPDRPNVLFLMADQVSTAEPGDTGPNACC